MQIKEFTLKLHKNRQPFLEIEREFIYEEDLINNPKTIVKMINDLYDMENLAEERLYIVGVTQKNRVQGIFQLSQGTATMSLMGIREIMIRLLLSGTVNCIMIHNHPSGYADPSKEDEKVSIKLKDACELMGFKFLDSIIIGLDSYTSLKELGKI